MTQEDKDLLLRDLCARLPYGVKCIVTKSRTEEGQKGDVGKITCVCLEGIDCIGGEPFFSEFGNFKPYLFPMSSMTEEQDREFSLLQVNTHKDGFLYVCDCANMMKWLLKNHFDIYGLIEKGLAINVTNLNIY